jgi:hypothetical protein
MLRGNQELIEVDVARGAIVRTIRAGANTGPVRADRAADAPDDVTIVLVEEHEGLQRQLPESGASINGFNDLHDTPPLN